MLAAKKPYSATPLAPMTSNNQINDDLDLEDIEDDIEFSMNDEEEFYSDDDYESNGRSSSSYGYGNNGSSRSQRNNGNHGQSGSSGHQEESHDDNRKDHHNQLERKRRASIKGSYNELKETIPGLKGSKASRAVILQRAVDCIADLNQKNKEHYSCVDVLMRENEILERQVNDLQRACDRLDNEDEITLCSNLRQYNDESAANPNPRNPDNAFRYLNNSNNASSAYSTSSDASSSNSSLATGTFNCFSKNQNNKQNPPSSSKSKSSSESNSISSNLSSTNQSKPSPSTTSSSKNRAHRNDKDPLQYVAHVATDVLQSIQSSSIQPATTSMPIVRLEPVSTSASNFTGKESSCQVIRPSNQTSNVFVKRHINNGSLTINDVSSSLTPISIRPAIKAQMNSSAPTNGSTPKYMLKINNQTTSLPVTMTSTSSASLLTKGSNTSISNFQSQQQVYHPDSHNDEKNQSGQTNIRPAIQPKNYLVKKTTVISSQPIESKQNTFLIKTSAPSTTLSPAVSQNSQK